MSPASFSDNTACDLTFATMACPPDMSLGARQAKLSPINDISATATRRSVATLRRMANPSARMPRASPGLGEAVDSSRGKLGKRQKIKAHGCAADSLEDDRNAFHPCGQDFRPIRSRLESETHFRRADPAPL